jgi:hypothetical protein
MLLYREKSSGHTHLRNNRTIEAMDGSEGKAKINLGLLLNAQCFYTANPKRLSQASLPNIN